MTYVRGVGRAESVVRIITAVALASVVGAAIMILLTPSDPSVREYPRAVVPLAVYGVLHLSTVIAVGLVGIIRASRPMIGAAGGLLLPAGLLGSPLGIPGVVLVAACGLVPRRSEPAPRELAAGLLTVLLGYAAWAASNVVGLESVTAFPTAFLLDLAAVALAIASSNRARWRVTN